MAKVYVAVNLDTGWDCVVGVFDTMEKARIACQPEGEEWDDEFYTDRLDTDGIYELHHIFEKEVK